MYQDDDDVEEILNRPSAEMSMFLAFFEAVKKYPQAKDLTYAEFPTMFVFDRKAVEWKPRKKGFAIGRVTYVTISTGALYYLRVLINRRRGPTSYNDLKTVDGVLYETFQDACYAMGLLDDDKEYIESIREASEWGSGHFLRKLFAIMLLTESVTSPIGVWDETWELLSEDFKHRNLADRNVAGSIDLYFQADCLMVICSSYSLHNLYSSPSSTVFSSTII